MNINESATPVGTVNGVNGDWSYNNGGVWTTEGSGSGYYYPNLNLTGTITGTPEPGTVGLAAIALAALAGLVIARRAVP